MRAILIPVKNLAHAKQRMADVFPQEQRTLLARAMLQDVFAAVADVDPAVPVFVVSSDAGALAAARARGWECLEERTQISESASVDAASRTCAARGVTALLRLPVDIPLVRAADIEAVLAACPAAPGAVLVPSRSGDGTNALLRAAPDAFPSRFGPDSLAKHREEARRCRVELRILRNPRIELDVDDEADLRVLAGQDHLGPHVRAALDSLPLPLAAQARAAGK
jgi:2-phospho-L-lactate/phosphoenolpyruvate guanylyltransferase